MTTGSFAPIAIVGHGVVLPGAVTTQAFADDVSAGRDHVRAVPEGRWGIDPERIRSTRAAPLDGALSTAGSYVDPGLPLDLDGLGVGRSVLGTLDPLFSWVVHAARHALVEGGFPVYDDARPERMGLVLGNLSFPTEGMARFGARALLESVHPPLVDRSLAELLEVPAGHALDRFMSGLPAHLAAKALGLRHGAFALDAACASSLYAIALAARRLHAGELDVALAGAVNRADSLFLHVGFSALSALSPTGQSRPFHRHADGLVPAEGAGVVALMRLDDARRAGRRILGIIRGVGLSNDGRARNLLAPSEDGQVRAMRAAWRSAGLSPSTASFVECHATGTPTGDTAELSSMRTVFDAHGPRSLPIGSLKSNYGHLITAAGVAGLAKALVAFAREELPVSLYVEEQNAALDDERSPFLVARTAVPLPRRDGAPRRAAISAFGFGGNNAHLVVAAPESTVDATVAPPPPPEPIVIAALALRVGDADTTAVVDAARAGRSLDGRASSVSFAPRGVRFPPQDLRDALPQQLAILELARAMAAAVPEAALPSLTTGVFVGMGCDVDVTSPGVRWRLPAATGAQGLAATLIEAWKDALCPAVGAARVTGQMPNIPANRVNVQLDVRGAGFTLSAEELSGLSALHAACGALRDGELDAALVGAVDFSTDVRDVKALRHAGVDDAPADHAALLLVLRERDAAQHGLTALATVDAIELTSAVDDVPASRPAARFGHAHAARGLVELALAVVDDARAETVDVHALGGARASVRFTRRGGGRLVDVPAAADAIVLPARRRVRPLASPHADVAMMPEPPALPAPRALVHALPPSPASSTMPGAPALPAVVTREPVAPPAASAVARVAPAAAPLAVTRPAAPATVDMAAAPDADVALDDRAVLVRDAMRELRALHEEFLAVSTRAHEAFLSSRVTAPLVAGAPGPAEAPPVLPRVVAAPPIAATPSVAPPPSPAPTPTPAVGPPRVADAPSPAATAEDHQSVDFTSPEGKKRLARVRRAPWLGRAELERLASEPISRVLGPVFAGQDDFRRVVRMPEPPLLLCDRVLSTDVTPGKLETNRTIVTESDVTWDKWYVHDGRVPPGILVESGQADLLAVSMMGVDAENRGQRVYRLLGCDLTYRKHLPPVGTTLHYDIHVDGFANHGATRIFFFHSDCREGGPDGDVVLSVRGGQAGFFSDEELARSGGILWKPEDVEASELAALPLVAPKVALEKRRLDRRELELIANGDVGAAFGESHRALRAHVRTPTIQGGDMLLLDRVTELDPRGGPWGRGYLRAELDLTGDNWFYDGHFKNDPCMPGTIMFEGCLQCLDVYAIALGLTVDRDGWRFEPTKDQAFPLRCRGQAIPSSRNLVYELFVREVDDGPRPRVVADILVTVDGLKALHCERTGVELVVDWPITSHPELTGALPKTSGWDAVGGVVGAGGAAPPAVFDQRALLATAWGRPSDAFAIYAPFDDGTLVPRLPGPPYHFMSRVSRLDGPPMGAFTAGNTVVVDYDVPPDAWFFASTPSGHMPFSVLLEVALQPCGWLSSFTGSVLTTKEPLFYRNLDGKGVVHRPIGPDVGTIQTRATLSSISSSAGMIIQTFTLAVTDAHGVLFDGTTVFGFFPEQALARQVGVGATDDERAVLARRPTHGGAVALPLVLDDAPRDPALTAVLPDEMLRMIDRVTVWEPSGGAYGLGRLVAEKDVDPAEWFFKAHFFQDPVQPGSLGIQAMLDTLAVAAHLCGATDDGRRRVLPIAHGAPLTWKYRGQVTPKNRRVAIVADLVERGPDRVVAECFLWVDGLRIYHAERIGIDLVAV